MALKDIRTHGAQWKEAPSPEVALPPPVTPRNFATIQATLPQLGGTLEGE